ncbi:MAG: metallophosphoesterase [Clostridia bacterium]|nr:metallophosphoesterase [Clostridia bacterium]
MTRKPIQMLFSVIMAMAIAVGFVPTTLFKGNAQGSYAGLPKGARIGDTIYEEALSASALNEWTVADTGDSWQWNPDVGEVVYDDQLNGVKMSAENGMQVATLPALGVVDYAYTAEIQVLSKNGEFGLVTDIAENSQSASYATAYIGDDSALSLLHCDNVNGVLYNQNYAGAVELLGKEITQNETYTLAVYSLEGTAYFFINGVLVNGKSVYSGGAENDIVGLYVANGEILVKSVSVKAYRYPLECVRIEGLSVRYADEDGFTTGKGSSGLRYTVIVEKNAEDYDSNAEYGILIIPSDILGEKDLTVDVGLAKNIRLTNVYEETDGSLKFTASLLDIPTASMHRSFVARAYMRVQDGDEWVYSYGKVVEQSMVKTANIDYEETEDMHVKNRLDKIFENATGYAQRITFSLFADFHYIENTYMSSVADLNAIFQKGVENNVDFVLHAGDFSNNYTGSPELIKAYKENAYNLPVYGIYGNHELEGSKDTMAFVTPALTNQADKVTWGTESGKIEDGSIGYYYFDVNGIRVICTDTNYSWNPTLSRWEHREELRSNSGNSYDNSFGEPQRTWLKAVLNDAADKDISCIVISHHPTSGLLNQAPSDAMQVREIFKQANAKRAGTVLMVMNGHLHTNHIQFVDDILYFDVNVVRNGQWLSGSTAHYGNNTFDKVSYDDEGNETGTAPLLLNSLKQGANTWFFTDPLNAIVTVSSTGKIVVEGMETTWLFGIEPPSLYDGTEPRISSGVYKMPAD